jgi:hypothetical protein
METVKRAACVSNVIHPLMTVNQVVEDRSSSLFRAEIPSYGSP